MRPAGARSGRSARERSALQMIGGGVQRMRRSVTAAHPGLRQPRRCGPAWARLLSTTQRPPRGGARVPGRQATQARQRGYILLPVMLAVALVATLAFMMNHEGVTNIRLLDNDLEGTRAGQLAHAGLSHALWQAQQQGCGPYTDLTDTPLGGDSYTTRLTTDLGSTTRYTLAVDQDTWIDSNGPTDNHGDDSRLNIRYNGGRVERPLFRFDLSPLAAGAEVVSATAWFYVTTQHPEGAVTLHRVTADWTEDGATWDNIGDRLEPAVLASIPPVTKDGTWVAVNLTAQVQAWVNGQPNFGIVLATRAEGVQGDYAPREHSIRPYLEAVVGTPPSSPAHLKAVGTLASGVSRTLIRNDVTLLQQPANLVHLQPDAADGKDTYLYEWKKTWNYGADAAIWVEDRYAYSRASGLLRFDLSAVPPGARVLSAVLELYQTNTSLAGGPVAVHRVTSDWVEGTQSGSAGAPNWTERDTGKTWGTAGGDYVSTVAAATTVPAAKGWSRWDITGLVGDWVSGRFANHGLALVAQSFGTAAHFASSDASDPLLRPRFTVRYTCACGSPCLAPQGQGTVLMVVINPTTLVAADLYKKALFESWGYAVSVVGESSNQATYDTAIAAADVVFVSETVNASQVGTKLKAAAIGVVSQDGSYNGDLGFATGAAWPVGAAINLTDTSHYITAPFRPGPLPLYAAGTEQLTVAGAAAPGLQTLADSGGSGALVVLDTGATTSDGGSAAGRRVMLPLGRDARLNWAHLSAEGLLLVQRALAWGMGADLVASVPRNLLFVSGGTTATAFPSGDLVVIPTALEQARIDLIESWGYTVNLIADDDSQANFDSAVAANDVAYVSSQVSETALGSKLKSTTIGVVNEQATLIDEFGFGQQSLTYKSRTEIDVVDNGHYITEPFATGPLTILDASQVLHLATANKGPGFQALAQVFNTGTLWDDALGAIATGGELFGGGSAAGRRVLLPWGDASFDVAALNTNGLTLLRRAIEWAEGAGSNPAPVYGILLVVADPTALSTEEAAKKALIESWGFTVELIDDAANQATYDAALAGADVVYISEEILAGELGNKLTGATVGIVNEDPELHSVFGFSTLRYLTTDNAPLKTDAAHYITAPFGGLEVTLFSAAQPMGAAVGTLAAGLDTIGVWTSGALGSLGGLLTLDSGAALAGGGSASGRRVQMPWSGREGIAVTDIAALTVDGQTIMRRAIEWAAGADAGGSGPGEPTVCDGTLRDEFNTVGFNGNDGTLNWATDWLETGESDGAGAGDLMVNTDLSDSRLQVKNRNMAIERQANLSGATTATLTLEYRRSRLDVTGDSFALEISASGGDPWTTLETFSGPDNDTAYVATSHDISAFISQDTRIRFTTSGTLGRNDDTFFDNVEIQCAP